MPAGGRPSGGVKFLQLSRDAFGEVDGSFCWGFFEDVPGGRAQAAGADKGSNVSGALHRNTPLTILGALKGEGPFPSRAGAHAGIAGVSFGL